MKLFFNAVWIEAEKEKNVEKKFLSRKKWKIKELSEQ